MSKEDGAFICLNCGRPIVPGQAYLPERFEHVACPSPDQIRRDKLWERARKILEAKVS